jgi:hypothetical protein
MLLLTPFCVHYRFKGYDGLTDARADKERRAQAVVASKRRRAEVGHVSVHLPTKHRRHIDRFSENSTLFAARRELTGRCVCVTERGVCFLGG